MIINVTFAHAVRMHDNSFQTFVTNEKYDIEKISETTFQFIKKGSEKVKKVAITNVQDWTEVAETKKSKKSE